MSRNEFIKTAWLFGSFSRGEETDKSDIDIMFDKVEGTRFGIIRLVSVINELEEATGRKIDLVFIPSMLPEVRKDAETSKRLIYERR